MGRKKLHKRRSKEKNSYIWLLIVVLCLVGFLTWQRIDLQKREAEYAAIKAELESAVAEQERLREELENEEKLKDTLKYIEQMAREKLGMVYPEEIVIEQE